LSVVRHTTVCSRYTIDIAVIGVVAIAVTGKPELSVRTANGVI
jgi:hypothetical protein